MRIFYVALLLLGSLYAQDLPSAPPMGNPNTFELPGVEDVGGPKPPAPHCGPKWAGGCWDRDFPARPTKEVLRDPWWYVPTSIWVSAAAYDAGMSYTHLSHFCSEGSGDLPSYPSVGQYALEFARTDLVAIGLGTLVSKVQQPTRAGKWVPRLIYVGMAAYATQLHTRGGMKWRSCP